MIRGQNGIQWMPFSTKIISEMLPEIHTTEKCDFLKSIICSQIISVLLKKKSSVCLCKNLLPILKSPLCIFHNFINFHRYLETLFTKGQILGPYLKLNNTDIKQNILSVSLYHTMLKYRNVTVNFGPVSLCHTFGYPHNVSVFLFLQLHIGVEYAKLKLLHEGILHQFNLQINEEKVADLIFSNNIHVCKTYI